MEFDYKVDTQMMSFMQGPVIRRVTGYEISGSFVLSRAAAMELIRNYNSNAPLSGMSFDLDLGDKRVKFNGGVKQISERPMTLYGLPVYIDDGYDGLTPYAPHGKPDDCMDVEFMAYGPMTVTTKEGLQYTQGQQEFARQRQGFWDMNRQVGKYEPYVTQVEMSVDKPTEYTVHQNVPNIPFEAELEIVDEAADWEDERAHTM